MLGHFLSHSGDQSRGARSTALHCLQWALGLLLTAMVGLVGFKAPVWILVSVGCGGAAVLLVFLGAFLYLLFTDVDALRSEEFSLTKLRIERGMVGDDLTGSRAVSDMVDRGPKVLTEGGGPALAAPSHVEEAVLRVGSGNSDGVA